MRLLERWLTRPSTHVDATLPQNFEHSVHQQRLWLEIELTITSRHQVTPSKSFDMLTFTLPILLQSIHRSYQGQSIIFDMLMSEVVINFIVAVNELFDP